MYSLQKWDAPNWIKRYLDFHGRRHPREMGSTEIEAFLSYLAVDQQVAASTQNQALSALLFLYREVLRLELDLRVDAVRAKPSRYLPTVLTQSEAQAVIGQLLGVYRLVVQLLYGSGLRQTECLQLRVKDVDFGHHQLVVRDAKGGESRVTMLPDSAVESLEEHLQAVKRLHQQDLEQGYGGLFGFLCKRGFSQKLKRSGNRIAKCETAAFQSRIFMSRN